MLPPTTKPPLSTLLPPLICGTATFNNQYNASAFFLPTTSIIQRALTLGINAFDTSPYYGPSEQLLGSALSHPSILAHYPRSSYTLLTKVGRLNGAEFDYSAEWIRYSIQRSCERLKTRYLDVVYCHDVEFVSAEEVLGAVRELRRLRDGNATVKYIGISGYPVPVLCELAELVLRETGEPLDAVMSYANFTLQNQTLLTQGVERLKKAGVSVVPNASVLGMGLLRSVGVPVGGKGDFHPAPMALRNVVQEAARWTEKQGRGERLEIVAIRWGLESWVREGAILGSDLIPNSNSNSVGRIGISVMGVSNLSELEETMRVWNSILDGMSISIKDREVGKEEREWSVKRKAEVELLAKGIWRILGEWRDYAWASPDPGFVNMRVVKGVVDEVDGVVPMENVKEKEDGVGVKLSRL